MRPFYRPCAPDAHGGAEENDEVGTMNDELETTVFHSSFIVPTSSFNFAASSAGGLLLYCGK
jgi:hypothetical protein